MEYLALDSHKKLHWRQWLKSVYEDYNWCSPTKYSLTSFSKLLGANGFNSLLDLLWNQGCGQHFSVFAEEVTERDVPIALKLAFLPHTPRFNQVGSFNDLLAMVNELIEYDVNVDPEIYLLTMHVRRVSRAVLFYGRSEEFCMAGFYGEGAAERRALIRKVFPSKWEWMDDEVLDFAVCGMDDFHLLSDQCFMKLYQRYIGREYDGGNKWMRAANKIFYEAIDREFATWEAVYDKVVPAYYLDKGKLALVEGLIVGFSSFVDEVLVLKTYQQLINKVYGLCHSGKGIEDRFIQLSDIELPKVYSLKAGRLSSSLIYLSSIVTVIANPNIFDGSKVLMPHEASSLLHIKGACKLLDDADERQLLVSLEGLLKIPEVDEESWGSVLSNLAPINVLQHSFRPEDLLWLENSGRVQSASAAL